MKLTQTEGFVLRKTVLKGADSAYTIFTSDFGKLRVIAKGVKKITSKRSPHLQSGNYLRFTYSERNDVYFLHNTELKSGFLSLKSDQSKLEQMYLFLFVLDRLLPELQSEPDIFELCKSFFIKLGKESGDTVYPLLSKLLNLLGYASTTLSREEVREVIERQIHEKIPDSII